MANCIVDSETYVVPGSPKETVGPEGSESLGACSVNKFSLRDAKFIVFSITFHDFYSQNI